MFTPYNTANALGGTIFYIRVLKLKDCLFVCAELIDELAKATDLKFGILVEHVVATNKF